MKTLEQAIAEVFNALLDKGPLAFWQLENECELNRSTIRASINALLEKGFIKRIGREEYPDDTYALVVKED